MIMELIIPPPLIVNLSLKVRGIATYNKTITHPPLHVHAYVW